MAKLSNAQIEALTKVIAEKIKNTEYSPTKAQLKALQKIKELQNKAQELRKKIQPLIKKLNIINEKKYNLSDKDYRGIFKKDNNGNIVGFKCWVDPCKIKQELILGTIDDLSVDEIINKVVDKFTK